MIPHNKPVVTYLTNCYAPPDQVSVGPATRHYYHVQALSDAKFDVDVVTASTSTVSDRQISVESTLPGVNIRVVNVGTVSVDSIGARIKYHAQFFLGSLWQALNTRSPTLVVASIPSLPIGWQGYFAAKLRRAKLLIDVRDLWSDSLQTTKLGKIPLFLSLNRLLEKLLYQKADLITCTSIAQAEEVRKLAGDYTPIHYVPNGLDPDIKEDGGRSHPLIREIRKTYGRIGLFAGKHTRYAALDTLLDAAKELENDDFALVLVGGGYTKQKLMQRARAEGMKNVFFHDPVPKKEIASFLTGADLFFINYSQEKAWKNVLPNKIFDYMYYNKPIIAAVVPGEITRVLAESGAGVGVPPGNPEVIIMAVRGYIRDGDEGIQPRDYLLKHFDRVNTVKRFVNACQIALEKETRGDEACL